MDEAFLFLLKDAPGAEALPDLVFAFLISTLDGFETVLNNSNWLAEGKVAVADIAMSDGSVTGPYLSWLKNYEVGAPQRTAPKKMSQVNK